MPIVSIEAPAGLSTARKKILVRQIDAALHDAYGIPDNMIFLREYTPDNVALAGRLRSERAPASSATPPRR
jgi:phenylpyruvate tautomerase PptA (4-oxalocrotonate tautomerase family)